MTTARLILVTATALLALAACKQAEPPQPTTPPPSSQAPVSAPAATTPDTTAPAASASPSQITDKNGTVIDSTALAGEFEGNGSKLIIEAGGAYTQTLNAAGTQLSSSGTWSAAGPGVLELAPRDKAAQNVRFNVISANELLSQDGTYTFKRAH